MRAPEASPERAAVVERIAMANEQEIAARREELRAVLRKRRANDRAGSRKG